jgi:hypothetical protein
MSKLTDYFEDTLRPAILGALRSGSYQAEVDRVRALDAARQADNARVNALVAQYGSYEKIMAAAGAEHAAQAQAAQAARARAVSRPARWREYVAEHPHLVDQWNAPRNYDPHSPPDWFE